MLIKRMKSYLAAASTLGLLLLSGCGASNEIPYSVAVALPDNNPIPGTYTNELASVWINYPTEGDSRICMTPPGTFPVHFAVFNPPAGARVRFTLDRHMSGGTNMGEATDLNSPFTVGSAGTPVSEGSHNLEAEIRDSSGNSLRSDDFWGPNHFMVNFTTVLRTACSSRCPLYGEPTITMVAPAMGPAAGGTNITITGTGFQADSMPEVTIGGTAATNVTVVNSTTITATTPAGTAGAADVIIANCDGQEGSLAGGFTYQ